ncbi:hypothetical protein R1flu_018241 [Riccia fluitans]|uniref:Uncharacterized protein n=1 Tax=Riccia fluitans TaxID=41844 RepID=A0ABD1ZF98_9MARC
MCSYYLEVSKASDEDLYAYSEEIKAFYMSGLEESASEAEAVEFRGATIYNLHKIEDGARLKDLQMEEALADAATEIVQPTIAHMLPSRQLIGIAGVT